jgi:hypothetical protein
MIYTIKRPYCTNTNFKSLIKRDALKKLIYFPHDRSTEELLNIYLKQKYSIDLWTACRLIIIYCEIEKGKDNDSYVVTISNKYWDTIARIITFGTGKLKGSQILRFLFDTRLI